MGTSLVKSLVQDSGKCTERVRPGYHCARACAFLERIKFTWRTMTQAPRWYVRGTSDWPRQKELSDINGVRDYLGLDIQGRLP